MNDVFDVVLLLALPASGKSEVRKYLASLERETLKNELHIGENLQLDDFPYVHLMRRIDDEMAALSKERIFFQSSQKPFADPRDWGTLVHLMNEDYENLMKQKPLPLENSGLLAMERVDKAGKEAGIEPRLAALDAETRKIVAEKLEREAKELFEGLNKQYPETFVGKTLVMEFARGGAQGSELPLKPPFGYRYSIGLLSPEILRKAVVLYIWVTPEESRRKNEARANPDDPGSILHHGVPREVMLGEYGTDDMDWLEKNSEIEGTITVESRGGKFHLPLARFDNRVDKTSFLRDDESAWPAEKVKAVHDGIKSACDKLFALRKTAEK